MRAIAVAITVAVAASAASAPTYASAGEYADELAKCMMRSLTSRDHATLARWMFSAASANPDVANLSKVTKATSETIARETAALHDRLFTQDCRKETTEALAREGDAGLKEGFKAMGAAATEEFLMNPSAQDAVGQFAPYLSEDKILALGPKVSGEAPVTPAR